MTSRAVLVQHDLQISRLYTPLNAEVTSSEDEDEDDAAGSAQLLPLHYEPRAARGPSKPGRPTPPKTRTRHADVWDEREELFDIGEESEEDDDDRGRGPSAPLPNGLSKPAIVVTAS